VRVAGIAIMILGYTVTLALALATAAGAGASASIWAAAAFLTLAGAIPVMMSVVGSRSPGALDNASGVATVVEAARLLGGRDVGVLITDAEELGMAGARAWALDASKERMVLNCDGVDDVGPNVVLTGSRPGSIGGVVSSVARTSGVPVRTRTFVPGLLTDSVAFADAEIATVTFMRGSFNSLARVHGPADALTRLHGTGIAEVAALMSATARSLGEGGS
jgi:Zn-dependent M28 family amino/carboxypeptidase